MQVSVSSTREDSVTCSVIREQKETLLQPDSPHYAPVLIVRKKPGIAAETGYFEIRLPPPLWQTNPPEITLQWVDFYRN